MGLGEKHRKECIIFLLSPLALEQFLPFSYAEEREPVKPCFPPEVLFALNVMLKISTWDLRGINQHIKSDGQIAIKLSIGPTLMHPAKLLM